MLALHQIISDAGMKPEFVIVENGNQHEDLPFTIRHSYVNYADYLDMVSQSKAILDITQQGQNGFSMRVMESIFLNKKLVSTNMALLSANFMIPIIFWSLICRTLMKKSLPCSCVPSFTHILKRQDTTIPSAHGSIVSNNDGADE